MIDLMKKFLDMLSYNYVWNLDPYAIERYKRLHPTYAKELPDPPPYWMFFSAILPNKLVKYVAAVHVFGLIVFHSLYGAQWQLHHKIFLNLLAEIDALILVLLAIVSVIALKLNLASIFSDPLPNCSTLKKIWVVLVTVFFLWLGGVANHALMTEYLMSNFRGLGQPLIFWISALGMSVTLMGIFMFMMNLTGFIPHILNYYFFQHDKSQEISL